MMFREYCDSPLGTLCIAASGTGITAVSFVEAVADETASNQFTQAGKRQLQEYFSGQRQAFELVLDQRGTAFQKRVWEALSEIPYGKTVSYGDIARTINHIKAVRAVGAANGKNPIAIVVPCHRVIGSNQTLTGYAGGMERKAWLLKHEGISLNGQLALL